MRFAIASILLIVGFAGSASASDTYTFTTTSKRTGNVAAQGMGDRKVVGSTSTFENETIDSTGKKSKVTGTCVSWTAEPSSQFNRRGACNSASTDGDADMVFWCKASQAATGAPTICWGYLTGKSGKYNGKTGSITWNATVNEDRDTSTGVGAGVWNN